MRKNKALAMMMCLVMLFSSFANVFAEGAAVFSDIDITESSEASEMTVSSEDGGDEADAQAKPDCQPETDPTLTTEDETETGAPAEAAENAEEGEADGSDFDVQNEEAEETDTDLNEEIEGEEEQPAEEGGESEDPSGAVQTAAEGVAEVKDELKAEETDEEEHAEEAAAQDPAESDQTVPSAKPESDHKDKEDTPAEVKEDKEAEPTEEIKAEEEIKEAGGVLDALKGLLETIAEPFRKKLQFEEKIGDTTIYVTAPEGAFDGEVTMKVEEVSDDEDVRDSIESSEDVLVGSFLAFDITFFDAEGNEVEPNIPITVRLATDFIEKDAEHEILHVDKEGKATEVEDVEFKEAKKEAVFEAGSFSVYAIVKAAVERTVTASDGTVYRIKVTYDSESKVPVNADLVVTEYARDTDTYRRAHEATLIAAGIDEDNIKFAHVFDISLVNPKTGEEYEPDNTVKVSVELLNEDIDDNSNISVVHITDVAENLANEVKNGIVTFETDGFSIYEIVDDGDNSQNARIGYRFWSYDLNSGKYELVTTQYFRYKDVQTTGMRLYEPSIPGYTSEEWTHIFEGWYKGTVSSGNVSMTDAVTINTLNDELEDFLETDYVEGTFIDVIAKLKSAYYITYADVNPSNIITTDLVIVEESGDTYFTIKDGVKPTRYESRLVGWNPIGDMSTLYRTGNSYVITSNITLTPKIEGGFWLIFDDNDLVDNGQGVMVSGGASYTAPAMYMNVPSDNEVQSTVRPADPTWTGYEFGGWYTDRACTQPFTFGNPLTQDTMLYAQWLPSGSYYRVIYWKQKPTDAWDAADADKTYDYAGSRLVTENVVTGQTVNLSVADTKVYGTDGSSTDEDKEYFVYNSSKSTQSAVVAANGTTVLNVYYDRQVITINFSGYLYYYREVENPSGTVYAYRNGQYIQVTPNQQGDYVVTENVWVVSGTNEDYTGAGRYVVRTQNGGTSYAFVNGQMMPLYASNGYRFSQDLFTNNSKSDYYWDGTSFQSATIYRQNGVYYRTRSGFWGNYTYSDEVVPYSRTRTQGQYHYYYEPTSEYTGTRYETTNNTTGTIYGVQSGQLVQLTYTTRQTVLDGPFYEKVSQNGLTIKGLYGDPMKQGEWPVSVNQQGTTEYWWRFANNNGSNTTLNAPWNSYTISPAASNAQITARTWNLEQGGTPSTGQDIYYYGEDVNGNFSILLAKTSRGTNSTLTVNNSKFYGYNMYGFKVGENGAMTSLVGQTSYSIGTGNQYMSDDLYIYYQRDKFDLVFYTNNAENDVVTISNVPHEKPLTEYAGQSAGRNVGNYFLGWYADPGFTELFNFDQEMPHAEVAVYGYWREERIRVVLVPGADNVYMGSQALSFRLDYDERIDDSLIGNASRAGYILDGWYTDQYFTNKFLFTTPVTSAVDGVDMTYQTAAKWLPARLGYGDDDEDHENVKGILILYAKWIKDTTATGVSVQYQAGEAAQTDAVGNVTTVVPIDTSIYDNDAYVIIREAPSEYNELYVFDYWEFINGQGQVVRTAVYPGARIHLSDIQSYEETLDEFDNVVARTVMLRAKYTRSVDAQARYTSIVYDGNTFTADLFVGNSTVLQGKTKDGNDQIRVSLNKEINQTLALPGKDDFYLEGYELIGWSFESGNSQTINFAPNAKVGVDGFREDDLNTEANTLYAVWAPKTYTVTVRQTIETGVSQTSFTYNHQAGLKANLPAATATTLNNAASFDVDNLGYYDNVGTVFKVTAPAIPQNANYTVRTSAYVVRPSGVRERIYPDQDGCYQILGDIEITYSYSLRTTVTFAKRDLTSPSTVLLGAVYRLTPVEFNDITQRWDVTGDAFDVTINASTVTESIQTGTYRVEEYTAPTNYLKNSEVFILTVRRGEPCYIRTPAGGTVSSSIAEFDNSGTTLALYDSPIRTVTLTNTVSPVDSTRDFTFTVYVPGLAGTDVGAGTTNNVGELVLTLRHGQSATIRIPNGNPITITQTADQSYDTTCTLDSAPSDGLVFNAASITSNCTVAFTNTKRATESIRVQKSVINDDNYSYNFVAEFMNLGRNETYAATRYTASGTQVQVYNFTSYRVGNVFNGRREFVLKDGEYIIFADLPVASTFKITEQGSEKCVSAYTVTDANNAGAIAQASGTATYNTDLSTAVETLEAGEANVISFLNTEDERTRMLVLTTTVVSPISVSTQFTYKLEFTGMDPAYVMHFDDLTSYTADASGNLTVTKVLESGDALVATDVPVGASWKITQVDSYEYIGSYTITDVTTTRSHDEQSNTGDELASGLEGAAAAAARELATIWNAVLADEDGTVAFVNELPTGTLTVTKEVINALSASDTFAFTVQLTYKNSALPDGSYGADKNGQGNDPDISHTANSGVWTFHLGDGDTFTIEDLPKSTLFTVTETPDPDYIAYIGSDVTNVATGTISDGGTSQVDVVNMPTPAPTDVKPNDIRSYLLMFFGGLGLLTTAVWMNRRREDR